jgi:GntR family phosphonate transport system transcriptional regulator
MGLSSRRLQNAASIAVHGDSFLNDMDELTNELSGTGAVTVGADTAARRAPGEPRRARWRHIAEDLRGRITRGEHPPGSRLPNEAELAARYGVHRHTLRQAVQALVHEGFVQVRQGSGTWVRELVLDYALQRRTRLSANLAESGEHAERELLDRAQERAGEWADWLRLAPGAAVQRLDTLILVRGRPVGLSRSVFPLPRLAGIDEAFVREGGITRALAALGVADYTRLRSVVSARLPDLAEADRLARPVAQPVLVVRYLNVDDAGEPVQAGLTVFAADAVQLSVGPDGWSAP